MPTTKTKKELQLAGTYRPKVHGYLDYQFTGEIITEVFPVKGWSKQAKEQFKLITDSLIQREVIQAQDIPSLLLLGSYLNDIQYVEKEIKQAKKEQDDDRIIRYMNQKIRFTKAFTELATKFFVTPAVRYKAAAFIGKNEREKITSAEELIENGSL